MYTASSEADFRFLQRYEAQKPSEPPQPNLLLNERGRNIRELQELLGHRSLATTARYTHIDRERLRGVVADLSLP